ncbi:anthranilate phosphoribosyltransferase [Saliterribacillus persicus]|uniref:Anthranilate phosphoribosyltransferase n=1 Tax=Saliterribacillus persicus TaxID=930114 RepID=A0A368XV82_9BACI|nr:anthranilate phosphoribosyltransferase [Saliterribacillus persicus]RCW71881.1 anthranilate phosphoribosyltransferase [Saliterribacillus persicus]
MQKWLKEVARGKKGSKDLSYEQTRLLAEQIIDKRATIAQTTAYLIAARIKTESSDELLAFIDAFRTQNMEISLPENVRDKLIDFQGPYNGRNSFVATIPSAILLAEKGVPCTMSASITLPPKYGTSMVDIFQALNINGNKTNVTVEDEIMDQNLTFLEAEAFSSPLKELRFIREEIGVRTILNTVEKLLNFTGARNIMLGAFHRTAIKRMKSSFEQMDYKNVFIVQGLEGSEDVPVHRNSFVYHWEKEGLSSFTVKPADYGLLCKEFDKNIKLNATEQAEIILSLLAGDKRESYLYYYNQLVLNTGLRYYLFGIYPTIEEGVEYAKVQLSSGRGLQLLTKWQSKCKSEWKKESIV